MHLCVKTFLPIVPYIFLFLSNMVRMHQSVTGRCFCWAEVLNLMIFLSFIHLAHDGFQYNCEYGELTQTALSQHKTKTSRIIISVRSFSCALHYYYSLEKSSIINHIILINSYYNNKWCINNDERWFTFAHAGCCQIKKIYSNHLLTTLFLNHD